MDRWGWRSRRQGRRARSGTPDTAADVAVWEVGDRIADLYDVLAVHGQGAMGLVYRVRHLGWDVDLALKSPRPELFATPPCIERTAANACGGAWSSRW